MGWRVREVAHGAQFELACHEIGHAVAPREMQALLRAVKWMLARAADDFPQDPETGVRYYPYEKSDLYPALVFHYTIDSDELCTLRYVHLAGNTAKD